MGEDRFGSDHAHAVYLRDRYAVDAVRSVELLCLPCGVLHAVNIACGEAYAVKV